MEKKDVITCFKCHKLRHIQQYCLMIKKAPKRSKKEAMIATWSDDDSSDSDGDVYFVAMDNV